MTASVPTRHCLVLYPGSFDPFHNGHLDVVEQAVELFGTVVVATMHNREKTAGLFTLDERRDDPASAASPISNRPSPSASVAPGLAVHAGSRLDAGADFIVKGLRTAGDFEFEQQMALTNDSVTGIRTVFLPHAGLSSHHTVSSGRSRTYGGDVRHLVPEPVAERPPFASLASPETAS